MSLNSLSCASITDCLAKMDLMEDKNGVVSRLYNNSLGIFTCERTYCLKSRRWGWPYNSESWHFYVFKVCLNISMVIIITLGMLELQRLLLQHKMGHPLICQCVTLLVWLSMMYYFDADWIRVVGLVFLGVYVYRYFFPLYQQICEIRMVSAKVSQMTVSRNVGKTMYSQFYELLQQMYDEVFRVFEMIYSLFCEVQMGSIVSRPPFQVGETIYELLQQVYDEVFRVCEMIYSLFYERICDVYTPGQMVSSEVSQMVPVMVPAI